MQRKKMNRNVMESYEGAASLCHHVWIFAKIYTPRLYFPSLLICMIIIDFFMRHFQRKLKSSPNENKWNEVDFSLNGIDMIGSDHLKVEKYL